MSPGAAAAAARADRVVLARAAATARWCAGAPRCTTASCWGISSGRISSTCSTILRHAGYRFDPVWFDAQREFRFPFYGAVSHGGVRAGAAPRARAVACARRGRRAGGTARFVDSSVERLQVGSKGSTPARHVVACNGRRMPLTSTGRSGEYVAGVRFKAWKLPSALHPTIDVHAPLTFDIYRSLERPFARRLRLSRRPSRRPQLRDLPGQFLRGGGAAAGALRGPRPHARACSAFRRKNARWNTR